MADVTAKTTAKGRVTTRTNYLLVDYENVQPKSLDALTSDIPFKVLLFVGASQSKVSLDVAQSMHALGPQAEYVRISGNGSNALDFHIAFYIGQLATTDTNAFFHVISKDTGFDPLIAHLKAKGIFACRSSDIGEIPILKPKTDKVTSDSAPGIQGQAAADKLDAVVTNLRQRGSARPRRLKTLSGTISALFKGQLTDKELAGLVSALKKSGHVVVDGAKVAYKL
jgi:hypothetical protein